MKEEGKGGVKQTNKLSPKDTSTIVVLCSGSRHTKPQNQNPLHIDTTEICQIDTCSKYIPSLTVIFLPETFLTGSTFNWESNEYKQKLDGKEISEFTKGTQNLPSSNEEKGLTFSVTTK